MKNTHAPHENTPSIKVLEEIKAGFLSRDRNEEDQKKLEAVTMQLERIRQYEKAQEAPSRITELVEEHWAPETYYSEDK